MPSVLTSAGRHHRRERHDTRGPIIETGQEVPTADEAGFRAWAVAQRPRLQRTAFLLCGDWHTADDLVQDALVKIYLRWPRIVRRESVDAYARRVLTTTYVDATRRPWRRELPYASPGEDAVDDTAAAALHAVEEDSDAVVRALMAMPRRQRAVVILRFYEGLSVDEVAQVMSSAPSTVRSQATRGLRALRALLQEPHTSPQEGP